MYVAHTRCMFLFLWTRTKGAGVSVVYTAAALIMYWLWPTHVASTMYIDAFLG